MNDNKDDDDWEYDGDKVEEHNQLRDDITATVAAFWAAERTCHNKITALFGGTQMVAGDGSDRKDQYGFNADDLKNAKLPWGDPVEEKHHWYEVGHWVKSFVWDGLIVDGIWGTIKGLGTLVGFGGWDAMGQAWKGLAQLATGLVISSIPGAGTLSADTPATTSPADTRATTSPTQERPTTFPAATPTTSDTAPPPDTNRPTPTTAATATARKARTTRLRPTTTTTPRTATPTTPPTTARTRAPRTTDPTTHCPMTTASPMTTVSRTTPMARTVPTAPTVRTTPVATARATSRTASPWTLSPAGTARARTRCGTTGAPPWTSRTFP
ncbi:hypothetical protein [Streptomyces sp. NPDC059221]|uniref:hypothetical protein n=2 Tax=unclassified Streptomyces TaxID=2593676 RepID=UPI0036CCB025